ncbi:MAG: HAD-IIA family hydrolase [Clostridia bacterium]|nr:HAD-IIA family hydrolase [Clostridia bacterium]
MDALKQIKCFLLDMDGTFYLGDRIIEGSLSFIDTLRRTGRDFLFLTNNSSHNALFYVERLKKMGLSVGREKILTSGEATARILNRDYKGKRAYVLGNEFLLSEMREAGIPIDEDAPEIVVIGYDTTLDYKKMTRVCDLVRSGLPYIATHPDFNCPTETGFAPDIGAIIAFIEASAFRRPDLIVGKPHSGIVEAALERTGLTVPELAMVGDRLYTDIATGNKNGMLSVLVMSGETTREMLEKSEIRPSCVFGRLSDMNKYL